MNSVKSLIVAALIAVAGTGAVRADAAPTKDIVQVAVENGSFTTLASLLTSAGLADTLKTDGPFTVFAPTDAAFAKVDKATLAGLQADKEKLRAVLLYHVAKGNLTADKVTSVKEIPTLNGAAAPVTVADGTVTVAGAKVVTPNIGAKNGVIHVIDSVMLPPAATTTTASTPGIVAIAAGNPDFSTLVALLKEAGLVGALSGDGPFTVFAPTNDAFAKVPAATLAGLKADKDKLRAVLTYHVVPQKITAAEVPAKADVKSLQGDTIAVAKTDAGVTVDGAKVVKADIIAANGVIHVIDSVILPAE